MEKVELTDKDRNMLFWASFLALMAAGIGFGIRVMNIGTWMGEFGIDGTSAGGIFGASLWPIAVGMILFSLIVDKIGYKTSMLLAAAFQLISTIWTFQSTTQSGLIYSFILAGFAHGIIESCINPLCATMYKKQKSKMLNILHASWPAGIVIGASTCLLFGGNDGFDYRQIFLVLIIPVALYGIIFLTAKHFPKDERVESGISYREMLQEFGGLSIFLATTFLFYELGGKFALFGEGAMFSADNQLYVSLIVGAIAGLVSGFVLKSAGKPLFFILCLIMIPLATAEIATDGWIVKLMQPVLANDYDINAGWAIVLSSLIMMTLRFFAGVPLKIMSPPALLTVSAVFSIAGLFLLSSVGGIMIFVAFILYGIGQTFYWPTVLGFTSEQFPKGGAMTLNTVSAMGLLTVGIFGVPFLGAVGDSYNADVAKAQAIELFEKSEVKDGKTTFIYSQKDKSFFGIKYDSVKADNLTIDESLLTDLGKKLYAPARLSENPTDEEKEASIAAVKAFNSTEGVRTAEGEELVTKIQNNGRNVLKVAAILPAILAVAFGLIWLYFRSRGGYKPVTLHHEEPEGTVL
ncbi:MAG: MFS family permease [Rubritalea sp.]|jgi:MFS family permease